MKVLLRVVLTVLLVAVALEVGIKLTPMLARSPVSGPRSPVSESPPDYALTLTLPSSGQPSRSGLFELPSSAHFRKQLLPGAKDAEAPAADIPLYPQSSCRMQVGQGTVCFVGFYLTSDSLEAVRSFYVRVLSQLGWQRAMPSPLAPLPMGEGKGVRVLETFAKPNEDRTVVVQLRRQDSVTTRIGLVAMASGGLETKDAGRRREDGR